MAAFLLECLFPTGWRRGGQLYWRLEDATREAERLVREREVRGSRVLVAGVGSEVIFERMAPQESEAARA